MQAACADGSGKALVQTTTVTVVTVRPTHEPLVESGASTAVVGGPVPVKGGYVRAGTAATITIDGRVVGTLRADASGDFDGFVTLPADVLAGDHQLRATGTAPDGSAFDQSTQITVEASAPNAPVVTPPPAK